MYRVRARISSYCRSPKRPLASGVVLSSAWLGDKLWLAEDETTPLSEGVTSSLTEGVTSSLTEGKTSSLTEVASASDPSAPVSATYQKGESPFQSTVKLCS